MKILKEVKEMWSRTDDGKGFEPPKCKQCGGQNVIWEDNIGCSDTSGMWGDVRIKCLDCKKMNEEEFGCERNELVVMDT